MRKVIKTYEGTIGRIFCYKIGKNINIGVLV